MNFVNLKARAYTVDDVESAAREVGCEVAAFRAVVQVETGGRGFDGKGRVKALFEPHIFYRVLSGEKRRSAVASGLAYAKWGTRPYPADSYPRILAACRIDEERALQAASWGLSQILGLNHRAAGFSSASEMVEAFCVDEGVHLASMARFIVAKKLDGALKRKDWAAFAYGYNGPRYAVNAYDKALAQAYAHFKLDIPMVSMIVPLPTPRLSVEMPKPGLLPRKAPKLWDRIAAIFRR